ncbi:nidogen-like domain-containing protein [Methylomagnum sp.]
MKTQETRYLRRFLLCGIFLYFAWVGTVSAGAVVPFELPNALAASDDDSSGPVNIGFSINFFGTTYTQIYVNNNGNATFDAPLSTYTPFGLTGTRQVIIAPLFADVDTRAPNSRIVRFGTPAGRPDLFVVDWIEVGYFSEHDDRLNSFQLILQDLAALPEHSPGDFQIMFNYDHIAWETGDASGGTGGTGGSTARVGFSNGTGQPGTFYELPGSGLPFYFLSNVTGLVRNRLPVADESLPEGRYQFSVRNGMVDQADLAIAVEASRKGRNQVKFDLVVRNFSKFKAENVRVGGRVHAESIAFPLQIGPISPGGCQVDTDIAARPFSCDFPVIGSQQSKRIRIVAGAENLEKVSAAVGSATFDPDLSNNHHEASAPKLLDPQDCAGQVLSRSTPASVLYEPTATAAATQTLKLAIINAGKDKVKIRGIEPLAPEDGGPPPFSITGISPELPVGIAPGDGEVFRVQTVRGSGLPPKSVQPPYFNIQFKCKKPKT